MQVQLVGLPASGKSTLARALVEQYPDRYTLAHRKYLSFKKMMLGQPYFTVKTIFLCLPIVKTGFLSVRKSEISWGARLAALVGLIMNLANYNYSLRCNSAAKKIILWDEMVLQRSFSIFAYSAVIPKQEDVGKFIRWANKTCPCQCVLVSNERLASDRLQSRGLPIRMKEMKPEVIPDVLKTHLLVFGFLRKELTAPLEINTDAPLERSVVELNEKLLRQLRSV